MLYGALIITLHGSVYQFFYYKDFGNCDGLRWVKKVEPLLLFGYIVDMNPHIVRRIIILQRAWRAYRVRPKYVIRHWVHPLAWAYKPKQHT
jgi:hypothetical protein